MKPNGLKTRIFLDSGDPQETEQALEVLGFLDGQTTNPSLIAKSPGAVGKKFSKAEVLNFYRSVVQEVSSLIPKESVSVEVYADTSTKAEEMLAQGRDFFRWIPNAHIKYPTTSEGLKAAEISAKEGLRVNMTLVFSQEQAAAVYTATRGANRGQVYLSPFIGRLDDIGENGMDLIANIIRMYQEGDHHVEVLAASVRSLDHLLEAIRLGSDIITAPFKILKEWADKGMPAEIPNSSTFAKAIADLRKYQISNLRPIVYQSLKLDRPWQEYNIKHELTDKGIEKFSEDWNKLIA